MNKKTLLTISIIVIVAIMGYLLYKVAREEFENRSSAPYPLPEVDITEAIKPEPSQTEKAASAAFNVSPEFFIEAPIFTRLPMYEFTSGNRFTNEFVENLPEKLELNLVSDRQDPVLGRAIIATKNSQNVVIYPERGELTYTNEDPQANDSNLEFGSDPNVEIYKSQALEFINKIGLTNSVFQYKRHSYVIATSDHTDVVEQSRNANLIQLTYEAQVETLPIIDSDSTLIPNTITIWLNSRGEIARLHYKSAWQIGNAFGNYPLLTRDEIRADLQTTTTKAKLINGSYPIGTPIESINITKAKTAYLSVENYLVPVYILEANVRVQGNRTGTGYLLLEAIKK